MVACHHHVAESGALRGLPSRGRLDAVDELEPASRDGRGRNRRPGVAGQGWIRQARRFHQAHGAIRVPWWVPFVGGHHQRPALRPGCRVGGVQHAAIVPRQRAGDVSGSIGAPQQRHGGYGVDAQREAEVTGQERGPQRPPCPPACRNSAHEISDHKTGAKCLRHDQQADDAVRLAEDPQAGHGVHGRLVDIGRGRPG